MLRFGIRRPLKQRLREEGGKSADERKTRLRQFVSEMDGSPIG